MNEIEQKQLNEQLLAASKEGDLDQVNELTKNGADVNAVDADGMTSLHWACNVGTIETVKLLVSKKEMDVNIKDSCGFTALHFAGEINNTEMVTFLLIEGRANFNLADVDNRSAFGNFIGKECRKILIQHIALRDPEAKELHYLQSSARLEYWDNCKGEVQRMQNEKIGNSDVSLCKFLLETDPNKLAGCVYDINIEGLKDKYPTYADMIKSQYDKGMERRALLLSSEEVIKHHFSKGDATSKYLTERFAETASSILTDKDVKNLRKLQDKKDEKVLFSKGAQVLQYCAAENGVTLPEDQARRLVETMMSSTLKDIDVKNLIKLTAPKIAQRPL